MASDSSTANVNGREKTVSLNGEPVVKRPRESSGSPQQQESSSSLLRIPKEPQNKVTVVLGAQWGDEGKGKVVDLLAMDADIVCRCQVTQRFNFTVSIQAYHFTQWRCRFVCNMRV